MDRVASTMEPRSVRHYPLDLPSLPFERYEHRRLTARDILVHRIISKLLFPGSRELSKAYDSHRKVRPASREIGLSHHNFGPIKQHDRAFARDVELLRKMLVTCSDKEWKREPVVRPASAFSTYGDGGSLDRLRTVVIPYQEPPRCSGVRVEEELLDMVGRYYMEVDDPATRLWLQTMQPPQRSTYATLQTVPAKASTRKEVAQDRIRWDDYNRRGDYKTWYEEDTVHLRQVQQQARTANAMPLYDGGACLALLRQPLYTSRVPRIKLAALQTQTKDSIFFSKEGEGRAMQDAVFPWPEPGAPRRVLHIPSWRNWQHKQKWVQNNEMPLVDFASGRTGRGLDRDGAWSTGRWYGDDPQRGRQVHARQGRCGRRRAASEPPPSMFTTARLPQGLSFPRDVLVFPKMSLITIDRRSRRRSLSRTRIAEMFNWDAVLVSPTSKPAVNPQLRKYLAAAPQIGSDGIHARLLLNQYISLRAELLQKLSTRQITVADFKRAVWAGASPGESTDGDQPWPRWWKEAEREMGDRMIPENVHEMLWPGSAANTAGKSLGSCANCTSPEHAASTCPFPCGFCGAPSPHKDYTKIGNTKINLYQLMIDSNWRIRPASECEVASKTGQHDNPHVAPDCPVAKRNRCKCVPFPMYHVAAKCPILCARDCFYHDFPPGHFKHKNAMGCKSRCCMCGLRGHSGTQCKWRSCRCGQQHLGQDCRFHPECRAGDCDRYLCGVHCQSCGINRAELAEGIGLTGGKCPSCAEREGAAAVHHHHHRRHSSAAEDGTETPLLASSADQPVVAEGDETGGMEAPGKKRGRRRNRRKHRPEPGSKTDKKEQKPWYAPLEPRTRPVVLSKSGKRGRWSRMDKAPKVSIGGCR